MATKTNMEKVQSEEYWFWCAAVLWAFFNFLKIPGAMERGESFPFSNLCLPCVMIGCMFRLTRAYKREIADLKSGGPDDSPATQDSE